MRQETQKIVTAFFNEQPLEMARTRTDGQAVWLHGNRIFWRTVEVGVYGFSMCGWPTVTTRERLNGLLGTLWDRGFPNEQARQREGYEHRWGVYQRKGKQYMTGRQGDIELNDDQEYLIAGGHNEQHR